MMATIIGIGGAVAGLISITGIGWLLARLLRVGELSDARPARPTVGWSFLLGCAAIGIVLQIPLAINGRITHFSFGAVATVGWLAASWSIAKWWRLGPEHRRISLGWLSDLPMLGRLLVFVPIAAAIFYCSTTGLTGYDARSIYALKARIFFDTGTIRGEDFQDIDRVHFNPAYPLLLPLVESEIYWAQGSYSAPGLALLFICFPLAIASISAGEMRHFTSRGVAATLALMLLMTPVCVESFEGASLSGSSDLPLAALLLAAVLEISRWARSPNSDWRPAVGAAILLAAAASTKAEGLSWMAACALGLAGTWLVRRSWPNRRQLTAAVAGGSVLIALLAVRQAVARQLPNSPYYPSYFAALNWSWIRQLADRPAVVFSYGLAELVRVKFWNLMWPCAIGSLVLLRRGKAPAAVLFWRFTVVAGFGASLFALVITPLHLEYELRTSFTRLMLHGFPIVALIMSEQWAASGWLGQIADTMRIDENPIQTVEQSERSRDIRSARAA